MSGSVLLIVVDNESHRVLFNKYLKKTSHHLVFAGDGEDGFDRFGESKPDLVIAHVNVARLDGTILCQLIRQQPRGEAVPYVLLSEDFTDPEVGQERIEAVGADAYLAFPFDRARLAQCVTPLLAFGRPAPSVSAPVPEVDVDMTHPHRFDSEDMEAVSTLDVDTQPTTEAAPVPLQQPTDPAVPVAKPNADVVMPSDPMDMEDRDGDTVVTYQNPFHESVEPIADQQFSAPAVVPQGMEQESPTNVQLNRPPDPFEVRIPVPIAVDPAEQPVPPRATTPGNGTPTPQTKKADPAPQTEKADPAPQTEKADPQPDPIREEPMPELRHDPLEEPPISVSGPHPHPKMSTQSRLIHEPKREHTPTGDSQSDRLARAQQAVRRGLDESQLGKRLSKRVRNMHRLLDEVDYYQLLGVDRDVEAHALQTVYFDLSLEFHPDRFFLLRSGDLKEKIYGIFRRLTEAYAVLSDDRRRAAYTESLVDSNEKRATEDIRKIEPNQPERKSNDDGFGIETTTVEAERFIRLAESDHAEGDLNGARLHLHLALAYEKTNQPLIRAIEDVAKRMRR